MALTSTRRRDRVAPAEGTPDADASPGAPQPSGTAPVPGAAACRDDIRGDAEQPSLRCWRVCEPTWGAQDGMQGRCHGEPWRHHAVRDHGPVRGADLPPLSVVPPTPPNRIVSIRFARGSARVVLRAPFGAAWLEAARAARWIVLRGRIDVTHDAVAAACWARRRTAAVRDHLVPGGVDPARLRLTSVCAAASAGAAATRSVELER